MSNTLFKREERAAVEDSLQDDRLYDILAGSTRRVMNGVAGFRLHPTELFYHTFVELDWLKGQPLQRQQAYCDHELWDELYDYLLHEKQLAVPEADVCLAIGTVMQAVGELLVRSGDSRCTPVAAALMRQIARHLPQQEAARLGREFARGFRAIDSPQLEALIAGYLHSDRLYSLELEQLLDGLAQAPPATPVAPPAEGGVTPSHLAIAPRKLTSVLVVLNAMYRAGWLTDDQGQPLTNRDAALNAILRTAFGTHCGHIAQLLNPSNNLDEEKNDRLLRRLLDPDEARRFIQQLLDELTR